MKTIFTFILMTTFAQASSLQKFIGTYKGVGKCTLVNGNRNIENMTISLALKQNQLPEGSLTLEFREPSPHNLFYFTSSVLPGQGTVKDPGSTSYDPTENNYSWMTYKTLASDQFLSSYTVHHEKFGGNRTEILILSPSTLGGPIFTLQYNTGNYEKNDRCDFVKVN